jgi:uncharacterized protein (TIGR02246 family)
MSRAAAWLAGLGLSFLAAFPAFAQQPTTQAPQAAPINEATADPVAGVEFALGRYAVTFNKHDADALAALWTPEGVYVDKATGQRLAGRKALAADFHALFAASPNVVLSGDVESVRPLADGVAMVDGTTVTVVPNEEPNASSYTAIFKRIDGKWLIDSVHEMPLPTPESPRAALQPLAWLVGHWQDNSDGAAVDTTVRWSPSEAFLIRSFTMADAEGGAFEGTQIIGWDPRAGHIRSWTFHSDGSFGEGTWSKSGHEWLVRTVQTLPDGRAASGTQVIAPVDADTMTVQTIAKEIDGISQPASDAVTVVRLPEPEADAPAAATGALPTTTAGPASVEATR